ncbi:hypothetical protein LOK49_Contig372G00005 [Camellia lanceoleosa]|nr:hypothetical protein LOK49_Contig372G00005 [Camellia lanceoleosa]
MLFVASAESQKPKLSPSPLQNPLSSSSETHVFRSKLPNIPISNHLSLCTYCFQNLFQFLDRPIIIGSIDPKSISCDSSPTNYTPNSRFGNNLKILLESLSSNTPLNQGFNSIAIGNNTDQVYGQALCGGDVTPEVCRDCIKNAS